MDLFVVVTRPLTSQDRASQEASQRSTFLRAASFPGFVRHGLEGVRKRAWVLIQQSRSVIQPARSLSSVPSHSLVSWHCPAAAAALHGTIRCIFLHAARCCCIIHHHREAQLDFHANVMKDTLCFATLLKLNHWWSFTGNFWSFCAAFYCHCS